MICQPQAVTDTIMKALQTVAGSSPGSSGTDIGTGHRKPPW
jgi:hypothetical protein